MIDFTPILKAVATLALALLTTFVIPYIKSKTTAEQQRKINDYVKIAVTAAEQIYYGPGEGKKKKAYVLTWLKGHGIVVDEGELDAMIEAAVYELTNTGLIPMEGLTVEEVQA